MKKLGQSFVNFNAMPAKITRALLRLVLPDEICLVSSRHNSTGAYNLCMGRGIAL